MEISHASVTASGGIDRCSQSEPLRLAPGAAWMGGRGR